MIASPMNDHDCLGPTTDQIVAEIAAGNPALVDLRRAVRRYRRPRRVVRTLPQRDDDGIRDGPKVAACRPPSGSNSTTVARTASKGLPLRRCRRADRSGSRLSPRHDLDAERAPYVPDVRRRAGRPRSQGVRNTPNTPQLRAARDRQRDPTPAHPAAHRDRRNQGRTRRPCSRAPRQGARAHDVGRRRPIDNAIASIREGLARFQAQLDAIPSRTTTRTRNSTGATAAITLTPTQAIDWIAELAMARADRVAGGTRRIVTGHRAMRGVLVLRPDLHRRRARRRAPPRTRRARGPRGRPRRP